MTTLISGTAGVTFPAGGLGNPAGAVVGTTDSQTLTNKTLTSPTLTTPNIDSAQIATVSGTAPLYMARAWVNFNGTSTVAIRASGNVSSITDNGTGDYTVNFTTAMTDANYGIVAYSRSDSALTAYSYSITSNTADTKTTSALRISSRFTSSGSGSGVYDSSEVGIAIFR